MDLSTTYLGIRLPTPFIAGAGPLGDDLDTVKRLEENGAAAIVLRSLCEEDINAEQLDALFNIDGHNESFPEAETYVPEAVVALGPDEYLEHLRTVKAALGIPVIASLNGVTRGGWMAYAELMQEAGADGLELQIYHASSDMTVSGADVERQTLEIVREVKSRLQIPIAVKLSAHLTAFAHFAKELERAGADGLVLFTRYHHVDIDVDELEVVRRLPLSDSSELALRLRGVAALAGRVRTSIAVSGGVHTALDVIKATMAGADATQMVSALLRHGPGYLRQLRADVETWMHEREWTSLGEMRGNMSFGRIPDPAAYERTNFRLSLR